MKKIHKWIIGVIALVLLVAVAITTVTTTANRQMEHLMQTSIQSLNLNELADGTYHGEVKTIPIHVRVEVVVQNQQIIDIVIVQHRSGQGEPADVIIEDILFNQTLEVDLIAGATYSSQAIIVAIQRALSNGLHD